MNSAETSGRPAKSGANRGCGGDTATPKSKWEGKIRLDKPLARALKRAARLRGLSVAGLIHAYAVKLRLADRDRLTGEEEMILAVIREGFQEFEQIQAETSLEKDDLNELLAGLCDRGIVEKRVRPAATDGQRGARKPFYVWEGAPAEGDML